MTIKSVKMGPGALKLGAAPLDISSQCRECLLDPETETTDNIDVLSGEQLMGDDTYTWTVKAKVIQDIDTAGFFMWCFTNKGTIQPFTFIPSTAAGRQFSGYVKVKPIANGGEVKKRNDVDFEFVVTNSAGAIADPIPGPIV